MPQYNHYHIFDLPKIWRKKNDSTIQQDIFRVKSLKSAREIKNANLRNQIEFSFSRENPCRSRDREKF